MRASASLVYANQFDIEGLIATTSTWMRRRVRPDVLESLIGAYEQVQPNLLKHQPGFPAAAALRSVVTSGQPAFGMAAVGPEKMSAGAELIVRAADQPDARPLWVLAWGGANTLAQALRHVRDTRPPPQVEALVSRLRVYAISDQDDAGPWIRREFPALHYVVTPSTPDGDQYYFATFMSPAYGGWGGRCVWRQPYGETRPLWTQGGDSYPGRDNSRDTVMGSDGKTYASDQATIWRWRQAFQHDFAARMDWTIKDVRQANHNPDVVVNGRPGKEPLTIEAVVGTPVTLDAAGTRDPDGDALRYAWFFYPEAGMGIPGQPVAAPRVRPVSASGSQAEGGIPPAPAGGPREPPSRVTIEHAGRARAVTPQVAGIAHVILVVEDDGDPSLSSYRRVIFRIDASPSR